MLILGFLYVYVYYLLQAFRKLAWDGQDKVLSNIEFLLQKYFIFCNIYFIFYASKCLQLFLCFQVRKDSLQQNVRGSASLSTELFCLGFQGNWSSIRYLSRSCWNSNLMKYSSKTYTPIVKLFCTKHSSITVMLCAKFQNIFKTSANPIEWDMESTLI